MTRDDRSRTPAEIWMFEGDGVTPFPDELATEEPLEIRLATAAGLRPVAVTLRTPGADEELAAGFLYAEAVIARRTDLAGLSAGRAGTGATVGGQVTVRLAPGIEPDLAPLERHFTTTSACGLCGKASLDALLLGKNPALPAGPRVSPALLYGLPDKLRAAQGVFQSTGGLHAAGLFSPIGELLAVREDVGRHNAVDKLVGWALLTDRLPFHDRILLVSGRAGYEIVQKALVAEAPIVCAVSAPSSLAVSLARRFGITLVGFLRPGRLNVYSGIERIVRP
jgi:FdhD protein